MTSLTRNRRLPWLTLAAVAGFFLCFLPQFVDLVSTYRGNDQLYLLFVAQKMVDGAPLYSSRIVETNPPLIIWGSASAVLLGRALHISSNAAFAWVTLLCCAFVTAWSVRLLRRRTLRDPRDPKAPSTPAGNLYLALAGSAILWVCFGISNWDFGQRDQLTALALLPLILAMASGVIASLGKAERASLGFLAALGVCLRPQHLLELVLLQAAVILLRRRLRPVLTPELISFVVTGLMYALVTLVAAPRFYLDDLPLVRDAWWAFGTAGLVSNLLKQRVFLRVSFVLALVMAANYRRLRDPFLPLLFLVSLAAIIVHCIQNTPYGYHYYPAWAFLQITAFFFVLEMIHPWLIQAESLAPARPAFAVLALLLLVVPSAMVAIDRWAAPPPVDPYADMDKLLAAVPPHTSFYLFSTSEVPFHDIEQRHLDWTSRFGHLWPIPALLLNENPPAQPVYAFRKLSPQRLAELETYVRTAVAEDLDSGRPAVVLVEHCSPEHPCQAVRADNFSFLPWFLQSDRFASAWSHYRQQPGSANFDVYTRVP